MCLFILLNMSLIPATISLMVLGLGLIFILLTLLAYFSTLQENSSSIIDENSTDTDPSTYPNVSATDSNEDDIDFTKANELSTLV